ncbi:hypothetical protein B5S32_g5741 [[Candida] boidinii]|nr:hypothetical protein B5S32_g5741 [[Candida] boidinii]
MLVGRTISADLDFPSEVTTDNWLRMLLKLFKRHDVRQERVDHVYAMLQQRPSKDDDLTGWLDLFVTQVQHAGSGNHLITTRQAVRDILTEQGVHFNGRLLSKTKTLAAVKRFVENLNLPNKKPKTTVKDQEASEIEMAMNGFYDNENSKQLNYTNKKFVKKTGEKPQYEHNHRYWCMNCQCQSCQNHKKRFDKWRTKKHDKNNHNPDKHKRIYRIVKDNENFFEYTGEDEEQKNLLAINQEMVQQRRQHVAYLNDLYGSSDEEDDETEAEYSQDFMDEEILEKFLPQEPSTTFGIELGGSSD